MNFRFALVASVVALAACNGGSGGTAPSRPASNAVPFVASTPNPIKHIVVVIQENRTFENFFAGFAGADAPMTGYTHTGQAIPLHPVTFARLALNHAARAAIREYNGGRMNGFDTVAVQAPSGLPNTFVYAYVKRDLIAPYWKMAKDYVLADHFFPREWGPSYTAHVNLVTGTTQIDNTRAVVDDPTLGVSVPDTCDANPGTKTDILNDKGKILNNAGPFPCFSFRSIANVLDEAGVTWRHYQRPGRTGGWLWGAFGALHYVRFGPDWKNVVSTPGAIQLAAKRGQLPGVAWVTPTFQDSDHPGVGSDTGPSWVSSIVNDVGEGPDWNSSLIIVLWDDWGGWYDNVAPPQLDFMGLGIRTPCLIISPYAKRGYVSHTQYESGSVLKTIEKIFNTSSIGSTDLRANDMLDALDFTQPPRRFRHFDSKYGESRFLTPQPGDDAAPDLRDGD